MMQAKLTRGVLTRSACLGFGNVLKESHHTVRFSDVIDRFSSLDRFFAFLGLRLRIYFGLHNPATGFFVNTPSRQKIYQW
tara:strand:- start:24449 stop:24688 length:240 start_codon:yes stop_codon:yes gene_type:complete